MGTHATKGPERYYVYLSALYIIDSISNYQIRAYRVACLTKPSSIQSLFQYLPNRDLKDLSYCVLSFHILILIAQTKAVVRWVSEVTYSHCFGKKKEIMKFNNIKGNEIIFNGIGKIHIFDIYSRECVKHLHPNIEEWFIYI